MTARLLRLELRRNPAWLLLPLLAAMTWFASPYGRTLHASVALWSARSLAMQGALQVIGPFAAGTAAWLSSRESRRQVTDLLAATPRPRSARLFTAWAATTAWILAFYLVAGIVIFTITAGQATWGGPIWWPIGVGALGILAFSAFGFALGSYLHSRFTAPLIAIGLLLGLQLTLAAQAAGQGYAVASPVVSGFNPDVAEFFPIDHSVVIVQLTLLVGVLAGCLALVAARREPAGPTRRRTAITVAAVGLALVAASIGFARTAVQRAPYDLVVPSLAGTGTPLAYIPVCNRTGPIPVCTHPAYAGLLDTITADLGPVTSQLAGLPGTATRIEISVITTARPDPSTVYIGKINSQGPMSRDQIRTTVRYALASAMIGIPDNESGRTTATDAQVAVARGILLAAGGPADVAAAIDQTRARPAGDPLILAAAQRFAVLSPPIRRDWLTGHLGALRAGTLGIGDLP